MIHSKNLKVIFQA